MQNPLKAAAQALGRDVDKPDRSYRLHADEYVPDGIRRIARGQLEQAHDELSGASKRRLSEAVHETRKRIKRLRASVRLSRDAIGEPAYARENAELRAAGRRLSGSRDAKVLVDTLEDLCERFGDELPAGATLTLRLRLENERDHAEERLRDDGADTDAVLAALRDASARTAAWRFDDDDFDALAPGLRRIYARGRKRMRAARKDPSPEHLHAWRKRVKDLWHASQIVRAADPKRMKRLGRRAHALADVLGDANDLHVLRVYVKTHPQVFPADDERQALLAIIDRRSAALRDKALRRGKRLYKRKPKKFVRAIERGWREHAVTKPRPRAG
jgi:CHAD domain-containing protein